MAEVTALRNNALPYPIYGAPWAIVVPIFDADGDLVTGAAGLDSERSLNGDTPADCTNEATEIGSSGEYYLALTAAEMTADILAGVTKTSTTGAKTTPWVLYPRKLVTVRSGTAASAGSATSTIILDSGASAIDDFYNGMVCVATIDGNVEVRLISDYTGSSKTATVVPDWSVAPDADDTFVIKLPEGVQIQQANATLVEGADATDAVTAAAEAALASTDTTVGTIAADVTTLLSRLSAARAGYLDNLSAGAVATAAKLLSYVKSLARNDVTVDTDIAGTYDDATDSLQAIRTRLNGAATVTFTGPVLTSGNVQIVEGDDYHETEGLNLSWTWTDATASYTSATATFYAERPGGTDFSKALYSVTKSGTTVTGLLRLTAAESALLASGAPWSFQIRVTFTSGRVSTKVRGSTDVIARIGT